MISLRCACDASDPCLWQASGTQGFPGHHHPCVPAKGWAPQKTHTIGVQDKKTGHFLESDASVLGGGGECCDPGWVLGDWGRLCRNLPCCGFSKKARLRFPLALEGRCVTIRQGLNIFYIPTFNVQLHSRENVVWEEGRRAKAALHQGSALPRRLQRERRVALLTPALCSPFHSPPKAAFAGEVPPGRQACKSWFGDSTVARLC